MIRKLYFLFFLVFVANSVQANDTLRCDDYSQKVLNAMIVSPSDLLDLYISLSDYHNFLDESSYSDTERDLLKMEAVEKYKNFKKVYKKECRRINKVFTSFKRAGGVITYDHCLLKRTKENPNIATITCVYQTQLKNEKNQDSVSFEVIFFNDNFYIIDGFFDEINKEDTY